MENKELIATELLKVKSQLEELTKITIEHREHLLNIYRILEENDFVKRVENEELEIPEDTTI